ncbi:hypothetical protein HKD37_16G045791 [Glycine soja]
MTSISSLMVTSVSHNPWSEKQSLLQKRWTDSNGMLPAVYLAHVHKEACACFSSHNHKKRDCCRDNVDGQSQKQSDLKHPSKPSQEASCIRFFYIHGQPHAYWFQRML